MFRQAHPSGDYYGDITITTPSEAPVLMNLKVTVLPFDLEPAPLEYAIYYTGENASGVIKGDKQRVENTAAVCPANSKI